MHGSYRIQDGKLGSPFTESFGIEIVSRAVRSGETFTVFLLLHPLPSVVGRP